MEKLEEEEQYFDIQMHRVNSRHLLIQIVREERTYFVSLDLPLWLDRKIDGFIVGALQGSVAKEGLLCLKHSPQLYQFI